MVDFKLLVAAIVNQEPVTQGTSPEKVKNNEKGRGQLARILRSIVPLFRGWISTKPGESPCNKNGRQLKGNVSRLRESEKRNNDQPEKSDRLPGFQHSCKSRKMNVWLEEVWPVVRRMRPAKKGQRPV